MKETKPSSSSPRSAKTNFKYPFSKSATTARGAGIRLQYQAQKIKRKEGETNLLEHTLRRVEVRNGYGRTRSGKFLSHIKVVEYSRGCGKVYGHMLRSPLLRWAF